MAYDLPDALTTGEVLPAADYNKIRECLEAVKPRIIQPVSTIGRYNYTLNALIGTQPLHLVGDPLGSPYTFGEIYWSLIVPDDYIGLETGVIRVRSAVSGNLRWVAGIRYGNPGEADDAHQDDLTYATTSLTAFLITELDISAVFANVTPGAQASLIFTRDAAHASDTLTDSFGVYPIPHLAYTP